MERIKLKKKYLLGLCVFYEPRLLLRTPMVYIHTPINFKGHFSGSSGWAASHIQGQVSDFEITREGKRLFLFKSLCCLPFFFFFPSFTVVLGRCPSVQSRTAGPFLLGGSQMLIKLCRKYPYLSQTGAMSWSNIAFDLKYSASFWLRFIFITAKLFRQHEVCDTCVEICTISTCMLGMIRWISNPSPLLIYCTAQLNVCITYYTDKEGPWKERE